MRKEAEVKMSSLWSGTELLALTFTFHLYKFQVVPVTFLDKLPSVGLFLSITENVCSKKNYKPSHYFKSQTSSVLFILNVAESSISNGNICLYFSVSIFYYIVFDQHSYILQVQCPLMFSLLLLKVLLGKW